MPTIPFTSDKQHAQLHTLLGVTDSEVGTPAEVKILTRYIKNRDYTVEWFGGQLELTKGWFHFVFDKDDSALGKEHQLAYPSLKPLSADEISVQRQCTLLRRGAFFVAACQHYMPGDRVFAS